MSSPKSPQAATTRTVPGVTVAGPWSYGPRTSDSTIRAVAATAYRLSRLEGRSSSPPATMGRTSAEGANQTGIAMVAKAIPGTVSVSPTSAIQSEPSPRK